MKRVFTVLLALLFAALGCSGGSSGGEDDAGTDSDTDSDSDSDSDTDTDTDTGTGEECTDVDGDGYCPPEDCDDESPEVSPGHDEVCGNGLDDDCDGEADEGCLDGTNSYFVDRDSIDGPCSDSNPGTLTEPWCTIDQANQTLVAGDTVYIRAGTYSGETIAPQSSGLSEDERIAYAQYEDETVTLTESVYCIRVQEKSYVTIVGLKFVDCERNLYIDTSDHVNVGYCEFDNPGGPVTWAGSRIYHGSQFNRVYRCAFSRYGNETYYADSYQDNGCVLDIGNDNEVDASDHNLVTDSTFYYGGHHILGVYANHNVVRNNTFHNEEWYECHQTSIGGLCGNRNVILNTSFPDSNIRNVIEDNAIAFSGVPPDQNSSTGLSLRTQGNIVRRNTFYHNDSSGVALSVDDGNHNDASRNRVYHNAFFRNGYPLLETWDPTKYGMMLARWVDDDGHNAMTGVAIKNNVFHENQLGGIYFYYVDAEEQDVAGNWDEAGDPGFVSIAGEADPFDFDLFDFHLEEGSPCVDSGVFLTRTVGAGEDSTVLVVEDAGYFTDGGGLVEGDMIQLEGGAAAVVVTEVNYDAGTITVDVPLFWADGTGVALPYHGTAPDQGAFEQEPP